MMTISVGQLLSIAIGFYAFGMGSAILLRVLSK
jgi:hypothetical protein